jgi:hypothetical protein
MAHFYGVLDGRGKHLKTATGHKSTGMTSYTACYAGAIKTTLYHSDDGVDYCTVSMVTWPDKNLVVELYHGMVGRYQPGHEISEGH